jgi:hypothetical protein
MNSMVSQDCCNTGSKIGKKHEDAIDTMDEGCCFDVARLGRCVNFHDVARSIFGWLRINFFNAIGGLLAFNCRDNRNNMDNQKTES